MPAPTDPDLDPVFQADPRDQSLGDLVRSLVDDGKAYARAEVAFYRAVARHRAARAKTGAILLGIGLVLLCCALMALVLALVLGLATLIGPFGAGMLVFAVLALGGGIAAMQGAKGLAALGGSEEEKAALRPTETLE